MKDLIIGNSGVFLHVFSWVFIGSIFGKLHNGASDSEVKEQELISEVIMVAQIMVTVIITTIISIFAKREAEKMLKEEKERREREEDEEDKRLLGKGLTGIE